MHVRYPNEQAHVECWLKTIRNYSLWGSYSNFIISSRNIRYRRIVCATIPASYVRRFGKLQVCFIYSTGQSEFKRPKNTNPSLSGSDLGCCNAKHRLLSFFRAQLLLSIFCKWNFWASRLKLDEIGYLRMHSLCPPSPWSNNRITLGAIHIISFR